MVCPQCKVGAFFVMNGQGERLPVYISDKGEIVPKDSTSSLEGYDLDTVYCLCCSCARNSETFGEILMDDIRQNGRVPPRDGITASVVRHIA